MTTRIIVDKSLQYTTVSALHRRLNPLKMLMHWVICFFGNLAGSLFVAGILTGYGGTFSSAAYKAEVIAFTTGKAVTPEWYQIFLRGIGCNWLVCLACFLAFSARETFGKIIAIWWPTFAFVCLGFDHVVANMYFIPTGIFYGNPKITVGYYIWKSMIPSLLGNIVGGGLFVGVVYWYLVSLATIFGNRTVCPDPFRSFLPETTHQSLLMVTTLTSKTTMSMAATVARCLHPQRLFKASMLATAERSPAALSTWLEWVVRGMIIIWRHTASLLCTAIAITFDLDSDIDEKYCTRHDVAMGSCSSTCD